MKHPALIFLLAVSMLAFVSTNALATFNYEYGADEYVTISNGISPNGKIAITTHGEGDMGYERFHVYLFDASTGKKSARLKKSWKLWTPALAHLVPSGPRIPPR